MSSPFRIEKLGDHSRDDFSCGVEALDSYFRTQVTQDVRRRVTNCFVAIESTTGAVAGYYTLSAASIPHGELPPASAKKLPRYPNVPAARIGRLAIDTRFKGRKLGAALLADAAVRTLDSAPAAYALLVDAKDESAEAFYLHHGFISFEGQVRVLFLPLTTMDKGRSR